MDSQKKPPEDSKSDDGHAAPEAPVIETVARGIGTAIGVVASTAAKVIGKTDAVQPEPRTVEPKTKEKPRKTQARQRSVSDEGASKQAASRTAKKKKKRAAHRIKLKRSNTKG